MGAPAAWSVLRRSEQGELVLACDFSAAGRPIATFSEFAELLTADCELWETAPPSPLETVGMTGADQVARWARDVRGSDREVRAVLGFCTGALYAAALAEEIADWQRRPRLILLDPEPARARMMADFYESLVSVRFAALLSPDETADAVRRGRDIVTGDGLARGRDSGTGDESPCGRSSDIGDESRRGPGSDPGDASPRGQCSDSGDGLRRGRELVTGGESWRGRGSDPRDASSQGSGTGDELRRGRELGHVGESGHGGGLVDGDDGLLRYAHRFAALVREVVEAAFARVGLGGERAAEFSGLSTSYLYWIAAAESCPIRRPWAAATAVNGATPDAGLHTFPPADRAGLVERVIHLDVSHTDLLRSVETARVVDDLLRREETEKRRKEQTWTTPAPGSRTS